MINILFEKVRYKSGQEKTLTLIKNKTEITWKILFKFINDNTGVNMDSIKLIHNNKYYKYDESSVFHWENFMNKTDDFVIFRVKYYNNIEKN
tara:strand:+ start:265 stop:540 length:276 start_codon:yes stop_codon:yes gene_type:complete